MSTERLEVRLDSEQRRKLSELAERKGARVSMVVREMIERAYDEALLEGRARAARELGRLAVEDVPDPETLRGQLEGAHEPTDIP